tara:strand:+ start:424 stop:2100 length:1677 start_codon:yes stop_codon:yes gene_type:complete
MALSQSEERALLNQRLESVLDTIAEALITSEFVDPEIVANNQKTIINGIVQVGRSNLQKLILYEKDVDANAEDLILSFGTDTTQGATLVDIVSNFGDEDFWVEVQMGGSIVLYSTTMYNVGVDITSLLSLPADEEGTIVNPINVSQFMNIEQQVSNIDTEQANEFLDTTIFELLPSELTRQERINRFFTEWEELKGDIPTFDVSGSGSPEFPLPDGFVDDNFSANDYSAIHDISWAQDFQGTEGVIPVEDSFITRLDSTANVTNSGKTMESLRDQLNEYLEDIDQSPFVPQDERPTYENNSDGFLKFRHLNQGIIVRSTTDNYIEGLNPDTREYLSTGFTVTMWVRFLDKVSEGTLFNFGNPMRENSPFGFSLETFVIDKDDYFSADFETYGQYVDQQTIYTQDTQLPFFSDNGVERFIKLSVREEDLTLRDSHVGISYNGGYARQTSVEEGDSPDAGKLTFTRVPIDFREWYFIVATYNPNIDEDDSFERTTGCTPVNYFHPDYNQNTVNCDYNPDFWRGNQIPETGMYTAFSGYGAKCKVEIISRSDLLRARGYKV